LLLDYTASHRRHITSETHVIFSYLESQQRIKTYKSEMKKNIRFRYAQILNKVLIVVNTAYVITVSLNIVVFVS
jgi:hypothetical protein